MRTTLALDDELIAKAQEYTGLTEKSAVVREALKAFDRARKCGAAGAAGGIGSQRQCSAAPQARVIPADSSIWIDHLRAGDANPAATPAAGMIVAQSRFWRCSTPFPKRKVQRMPSFQASSNDTACFSAGWAMSMRHCWQRCR